jgi:hypothetical protein
MKILFLTLIVLTVFAHSSAEAQVKKFRWSTELCEYEGVYDARRFSEKELRNTEKLVSASGVPLQTSATVRKFEQIAKLNVDALEHEYKKKREELLNLDIVDLPYFEELRRKKLKELEQVYALSRVTMLAYENPSVIREYKAADACVAKYAAPLINGGEDLLNVWRAVNENSRRNNADPQRVERIFNEQMNSADREKYARIEVMSFGWWNCANQFIEYVEYDGTAEEEFKKLFKSVKEISCDEP